MKINRENILICMLMLMAALYLSWRYSVIYKTSQKTYIKIYTASSKNNVTKLYYDQGYGFNEYDAVENSVIDKYSDNVWLFVNELSALHDNKVKQSFNIPNNKIYRLLIPSALCKNMSFPGSVIEFIDGLGNVLRKVDVDSCVAPERGLGKLLSGREIYHLSPPWNPVREKAPLLTKMGVVEAAFESILFLVVCAISVWMKNNKLTTQFVKEIKEKSEIFLRVVFILITAIYLLAYYPLNSVYFPLIFDKVLYIFYITVALFFVVKFNNESKKINIFILMSLLFVSLALISIFMHYLSLVNFEGINHIRISVGHNNKSYLLFSVQDGLRYLFEKKASNGSQVSFLFFFPVMIIASICLFSASKIGWRKFTWIPVVFFPSMAVGFYQYFIDKKFCSLVLDNNPLIGLASNFISWRFTLFLVLPLCLLNSIVQRNKFIKIFFIFQSALIIYLSYISFGRTTIFGILLMVLISPMIYFFVKRIKCRVMIKKMVIVYLLVAITILVSTVISRHRNLHVLPERVVAAVTDALTGKIANGSMSVRAEMSLQGLRLFMMAPLSGWGPGAYEKNSSRLRFFRVEAPNLTHDVGNLYILLLANFGLVGFLIMCFLLVFPVVAAISVYERIDTRDERWTVAIILGTVIITFLLFLTNVNINYPETNWLYAIYLGYLLSVSVKYKHNLNLNICTFSCMFMFVALMIFSYATYMVSFGSSGYKNICKNVITFVEGKYKRLDEIKIFDNKQDFIDVKTSNILIKTNGIPFFRDKYTTFRNEFRAKSRIVSFKPSSDLFCLQTSIESFDGSDFYMHMFVLLDGKPLEKRKQHHFINGKKIAYYYVPGISGKNVDIQLEVTIWKSIRYHDDARSSIEQNYMPFHRDFISPDIEVVLIPFL